MGDCGSLVWRHPGTGGPTLPCIDAPRSGGRVGVCAHIVFLVLIGHVFCVENTSNYAPITPHIIACIN